MTSTSGRVPIAFRPGGGTNYPVEKTATSIATPPPVIIQGAATLQNLGAFSVTLPVAVPALADGDTVDLPLQVPLTTFPGSFVIQKGFSGIIVASIALQTPPTESKCVVGLPALSLFFKNGQQLQPGTGTWTLVSGVQYTGATLNTILRVLAVGACAAQKLSVLAQAQLLGVPA